MKRRKFLQQMLGLLGSVSFLSFAYPVFRYFESPIRKTKPTKIILKKGDVPVDGVLKIVYNNTPALLIDSPRGYIALSRVCTHMGCLVNFDRVKRKLICPCHAGIFDLEGRVISGPPPLPLERLPLNIEGESIVIG